MLSAQNGRAHFFFVGGASGVFTAFEVKYKCIVSAC